MEVEIVLFAKDHGNRLTIYRNLPGMTRIIFQREPRIGSVEARKNQFDSFMPSISCAKDFAAALFYPHRIDLSSSTLFALRNMKLILTHSESLCFVGNVDHKSTVLS